MNFISENMLKGKKLAELYFTRRSETNIWVCKCGARRQQKGSGYSNLCTHITSDHPEYLELKEGIYRNESTIMNYVYPANVKKVFGWCDKGN